jgi:hypothetical protein
MSVKKNKAAMAIGFLLLAAFAFIELLPNESGISGISLGSIFGDLSASQIAQYAANAGFTGANIAVAVAVALAESGGSPNALGDVNISPGGSVGLWQINLAAHPELAGENLNDPQTNANAAFGVYTAAGNSFSPWTTYVDGTYNSFLAQAEAGVNA